MEKKKAKIKRTKQMMAKIRRNYVTFIVPVIQKPPVVEE